MKSILEKKIGAYVGKSRVWTTYYTPGIRASWPMAKISFFNDYLIVKVLFKEFRLNYKNIDDIKKVLLGIQIIHHEPKVEKYVYISGIGDASKLFEIIQKTIKEKKLKIKIR